MKAKIDWSLQRQQLGEAMARVYRKESTVNEEADSMIDYLISCFDAPIEAAEETIAELRERVALLAEHAAKEHEGRPHDVFDAGEDPDMDDTNLVLREKVASLQDQVKNLHNIESFLKVELDDTREMVARRDKIIQEMINDHDKAEKALRRKLRKVRRKLQQAREEMDGPNPLKHVPASHTFTGTASEMYDRVGNQIKESGLRQVGDVPRMIEEGTLDELDLSPGDIIEEVDAGLIFIVPAIGSSMNNCGRELENHRVYGLKCKTKDDPLAQQTDRKFLVLSRASSLPQEAHGYVAT